MRRKPFFKEDVKKGALGSPPLFELLKTLKPDWWFSAHLHVKFEATYFHSGGAPVSLPPNPVETNPDEIVIGDDDDDDEPTPSAAPPTNPGPSAANLNPDEITLDDEEDDVAPAPVAPPPRERTNFLALDKCIPNSRRQFLEVSLGLQASLNFGIDGEIRFWTSTPLRPTRPRSSRLIRSGLQSFGPLTRI